MIGTVRALLAAGILAASLPLFSQTPAAPALPATQPQTPSLPIQSVPQPPPQTAAQQPAQPAPAFPAVPVAAASHPLTPPDLDAFFDGIFPLQLERSDIAGASVLVMKDGNILLEKGYGYADVKTKKPVDPNATIFRLASISKLFTWISIMQLEEQGKISLDTDVNQYLDFNIRPAFGKPVTLRNLMTHTGGFEEELADIILTNPSKAISLRDDMINNQPMRLFPPGQVPAYSNYGVGLASYIVQRVSEQPFAQYVQEHIFAPLGMTHSSFDQPLPQSLAWTDSQGYRSNTTKPPVGFEIFNPVGAGGVSSTAGDMGRFGQALLNGGELDGHRILQAETLATMWTAQYRASPALPPICMGFYENWRNHLRWVGHEGDLIAFHSLFFVEPQQKLVLFVSYNSAGGARKARPEIINWFSDRYFPGEPSVTFVQKPAANFRDVAGQYMSTRRADSTRLRISNLIDQMTAKVDKNGVLTVDDLKDLRGHPIKWKLIGTDLWQAENDQQRLFAIRDGRGNVVRLAVDFPGVQLERVPLYANSLLVLPAIGISYGILVLVLLATLIRVGRQMFLRRRNHWQPQPGTRWLSWGPRSASVLWVLYVGAVVVYFAIKGDNMLPPTPEWYPWFVAMNWITGVCLFFSLFAAIDAVRIWYQDVRRITQVKFALVGAACVVLSCAALYYHWLGPTHRI